MLILKRKREGVDSPTRCPFGAYRQELTNFLTKMFKDMVAKKPIKKNKTRIKTVLATLKETTILLQGSKNKVVIKVSVILASVVAGINLLIELI